MISYASSSIGDSESDPETTCTYQHPNSSQSDQAVAELEQLDASYSDLSLLSDLSSDSHQTESDSDIFGQQVIRVSILKMKR